MGLGDKIFETKSLQLKKEYCSVHTYKKPTQPYQFTNSPKRCFHCYRLHQKKHCQKGQMYISTRIVPPEFCVNEQCTGIENERFRDSTATMGKKSFDISREGDGTNVGDVTSNLPAAMSLAKLA